MSYIGKMATVIPFVYIEITPFCLIAGIYLLSIFFRSKHGFLWLLGLTVSASITLIAFHDEGGASAAFSYGSLLIFLTVLFSPLLCIRSEGDETESEEKKGTDESSKESSMKRGEVPFITGPKVASVTVSEQETKKNVNPMSENKTVNGDVQLAHVFQVLKKLQSMKLSSGDRLETDVIQNMLTVYQAKGTLSLEETATLNNYLATLLKLMSKYSV